MISQLAVQTTFPVISVASKSCPKLPQRARQRAVRPQATLGPELMGLAKTVVTSTVVTSAAAGLLAALAPNPDNLPRRVPEAMTGFAQLGALCGVGVGLPQAVAAITGVPLGIVVGASVIGTVMFLMAITPRDSE